jgi:hypothetical protein
MFKIDDIDDIESYNGVFYDNIKWGTVTYTTATFTGGAVLTNVAADTNHNRFVITDDNNKLYISTKVGDPPREVTLANGSYTITGMVDRLRTALGASGITTSILSVSA